MNVKKTIASIAAIAMVASATSLAPLFTGTSISADELETIGAETPETTDPNAGIDLQAMPDISGAAVANLEGATGTATYADKTLTINLTKGESSTVSGTGHPTLNDGNSSNTSGYQNGAFKVTVNGNFSGYEMVTKSPDSDGTKYYKPDDGSKGATNLSASGLVLYLDADAVFTDAETKEVKYKVALKDSSNNEEIITIVLKNATPETTETPTLTVGNDCSVDQGGTGTVAVSGTNVTVTLDSTSEGLPQEGEGTPNYHVVIPVTGLDSTWTFDSTSEYGYDSEGNKDWNITTGQLKLWLPVESGSCTIKLKKDTTVVTIVVTTVNGSTVVTPEPEEPTVTEPTAPTDAEKLDTAISTLESGYFNWDFSWLDVNDQGHLDSITSNAVANAGVDGIEAYLVNYTTGSNGMVTFTIKFKVGTEEVTRDVTLQCKAPAPVVVPDTPVTIPDPIIYVPGTSTSVSSGAAAVTTVSSAKEITASKRSDITVNAAETDVTPTMVEAFVKNKNAKTLTLQYSSTLKVAIDKNNINDADANLDFSVSGENFLSSKTIKNNKTLKKASKIVQIDFVNKGDLEGIDKVTVKSKVGIGYAGKTVTIYEYVNGKLVKVGIVKVNGAGLVKFDTDHLGQFVIAVQ